MLDLSRSSGKEFDSVFDVGGAAGVGQLFDGDRSRRINSALLNPSLETVEVQRNKILRESGSD